MKATISPSMGYYIIDSADQNAACLLSLDSMQQLDSESIKHSLSLAQDWQVIEGEDSDSVLTKAKNLAMIIRCVSLTRLRLMISNDEIGNQLFEEIENLISSYVNPDDLVQRLAVAPYARPERIKRCAMLALSSGYGAIGSILSRLYDLQPLLRRLSHAWLSLSIDRYLKGGVKKQEWWVHLYETGNLLKILEAVDGHAIKSIFGNIAFTYQSPSERESIASIGNELAEKIFGGEDDRNKLAAVIYADDSPGKHLSGKEHFEDGRVLLQRALTEIGNIARAIAIGDESNAERYLRELIDRQTINESSKKHAIKSLCNLAKQCADMFRTDFEYICLSNAQNIDATDSWVLVQLGDHYKRRGLYNKARELVSQSISYGAGLVGECLLADIFSQEGMYREAIEMYQAMPLLENEVSIRTAIADNYRKLGEFDKAFKEYDELENLGMGSDRTLSGRAEILRRKGRLDEAKRLYHKILTSYKLDQRSNWTYRISYSGVLKQLGQFDDALVEVEGVINEAPYFMTARVLRSSLWGLLDKADLGLDALPREASSYSYTAYGEWISEYTRGLLLLRTERYKDAQDRLLFNLERSILETEERAMLRLAAALALIVNNKSFEAKKLVVTSEIINNAYVNYLATVLEYHICILDKDIDNANSVLNRLRAQKTDNVILWPVVDALSEGRMAQAIKLEIDAMLGMAA